MSLPTFSGVLINSGIGRRKHPLINWRRRLNFLLAAPSKNMDNTNKPMGGSKNKKLLVILGLVLVVAIIVVAAVMSSQKSGGNQGGAQTNGDASADIPEDAQPYVPEGTSATGTEGEVAIPETLKEATVAVVGANPIAKDGTVVTTEGVAAKNDAVPMSPEAPKQTPPVTKDSLPASVIKLEVSAAGWKPAEFSVKAGAPVTLAITSADDFTHVFMFDDSSLSAVAVGVSPRETRAITFNAPDKAGEYGFRCDVPGHASRGEVGKMIVK